jgi:hypothetical protein
MRAEIIPIKPGVAVVEFYVGTMRTSITQEMGVVQAQQYAAERATTVVDHVRGDRDARTVRDEAVRRMISRDFRP